MNFTLLKKRKNEDDKPGYTPVEIIEKSSKLSGDWLEKEVRKSFPVPPQDKKDNHKEPVDHKGKK